MNTQEYVDNLIDLSRTSDNYDERILKTTTTDNKNNNYLDIEVNGQKILRFPLWIPFGSTDYFIELHKDVPGLIENLNGNIKVKNPLWVTCPLTYITQSVLNDNIVKIYDWYYLNILPADTFGCCQLYLDCSDAKACVHSDKVFRTRCIYKRNIENNLIFYGKNRNI